jgi:copper chaperone CopZ
VTNFIDTETSTVELAVQGMTCGSCERRVRDALAAVPGATEVTINLEHRSATVRWATVVADVQALIAAVRSAGYDAAVSQASGAATRPVTRRAEPGCCCGGHR